MSNLSLRPPRRTFSKIGSTPTVMAEAFARAGWDASDPRPASPRMPEPQSRQTPEHASAPIPFKVFQCISSGVFDEARRLDLHGCNQSKAHRMLEQFIRKRHGDGNRVVLVITGKGSGTLKRLVPGWLEAAPFKEFVVDTCVADPWNGGEGARYVYLRQCRMRRR